MSSYIIWENLKLFVFWNVKIINFQKCQATLKLPEEVKLKMIYHWCDNLMSSHLNMIAYKLIYLQAEDNDRALILRLYEAFGGRASVTVSTCLPIKTVHLWVVFLSDKSTLSVTITVLIKTFSVFSY